MNNDDGVIVELSERIEVDIGFGAKGDKPVKGVDYWTGEDMLEILREVRKALSYDRQYDLSQEVLSEDISGADLVYDYVQRAWRAFGQVRIAVPERSDYYLSIALAKRLDDGNITVGDEVVPIEDSMTFLLRDVDEVVFSVDTYVWIKAIAVQGFRPVFVPTKVSELYNDLGFVKGPVKASGTFTPEGNVTQGNKAKEEVIGSYPGVVAKMEQATLHDTPNPKRATLKMEQRLKSVVPKLKKLVKTSIQGVSGTTSASKASANSVAGMEASVVDGVLILTPKPVSFSNVSVPIAASAISVATGEVSDAGTGDAVMVDVERANGDAVVGLGNGGNQVVVDLESGEEVTVATGEVSDAGTGDAVMVGLGSPIKKYVLKDVGNPTFEGSEGTVNVVSSEVK